MLHESFATSFMLGRILRNVGMFQKRTVTPFHAPRPLLGEQGLAGERAFPTRRQGRNASFSENLFCRNFPLLTKASASPAKALFPISLSHVSSTPSCSTKVWV